jgi:teichuronic acid biosynthesis glycosyltransferase TuaG
MYCDASPLVSVITPCRNGELFLRRVVESVRRQSVSVQHVIVDDNSSDGSGCLIRKLSCEYPWVTPVILSESVGAAQARDIGVANALGRFLAFLDVDDFWLDSKLNSQISFMLENGYPFTFTDYRFVSLSGEMIGSVCTAPGKVSLSSHIFARHIGCLTVVIDRRIVSEKLNFCALNNHYRAEDFLVWHRIISRHGPAVRCPYDLARYTIVPGSRSSSYLRNVVSVLYLYQRLLRLPLYLVCLATTVSMVRALLKRYRCRPRFPREAIDANCEWSLLSS